MNYMRDVNEPGFVASRYCAPAGWIEKEFPRELRTYKQRVLYLSGLCGYHDGVWLRTTTAGGSPRVWTFDVRQLPF